MKPEKYPYENAEMHIVMLENSDVITTSGGTNEGWEDNPGGMDTGGWDVN